MVRGKNSCVCRVPILDITPKYMIKIQNSIILAKREDRDEKPFLWFFDVPLFGGALPSCVMLNKNGYNRCVCSEEIN